jgi:hypothetical protein
VDISGVPSGGSPVLGTNKVVMWSYPIINDGVYVIDVRNGLYIFRYTGPRAGELDHLSFLGATPTSATPSASTSQPASTDPDLACRFRTRAGAQLGLVRAASSVPFGMHGVFSAG